MQPKPRAVLLLSCSLAAMQLMTSLSAPLTYPKLISNPCCYAANDLLIRATDSFHATHPGPLLPLFRNSCCHAADDSLIRATDKLPGDALALSMGSIWEVIRSQKDLNLPAHKVGPQGRWGQGSGGWLGRGAPVGEEARGAGVVDGEVRRKQRGQGRARGGLCCRGRGGESERNRGTGEGKGRVSKVLTLPSSMAASDVGGRLSLC